MVFAEKEVGEPALFLLYNHLNIVLLMHSSQSLSSQRDHDTFSCFEQVVSDVNGNIKISHKTDLESVIIKNYGHFTFSFPLKYLGLAVLRF